jgi:membrane protein implicated in regulation of membrane protease activity
MDPELYWKWYVAGVIFLVLFIAAAVVISVIKKRHDDKKWKNLLNQKEERKDG